MSVTPEIVLAAEDEPVLTDPVLLVLSDPAETRPLAVNVETPVTCPSEGKQWCAMAVNVIVPPVTVTPEIVLALVAEPVLIEPLLPVNATAPNAKQTQ